MDGKGLPHSCSQCDNSSPKRFIRRTIIPLVVGGNDPNQKDKVRDYANNSIGHDAGPELEILQHEDKDEEHNRVDYHVGYAELVGRDETHPLRDDELEVQ